MPEFDTDFMRSPGKPITYNNEELIRSDRIQVNKNFHVSVKLVSTNSEWKQGDKIKDKR